MFGGRQIENRAFDRTARGIDRVETGIQRRLDRAAEEPPGIAGTEIKILFGDVTILRRNYSIYFSEEAAKRVLCQKEIRITVNLHQGPHTALFWTCDLSREYVAINANYRT